MNVYIVKELIAWESESIVSAHLDPAAAVKAMAEYAEASAEPMLETGIRPGDQFTRWMDTVECTLLIQTVPLT